MIERWKDIQGFEGKYQISNTGKVKSLKYNNTNIEKILQPRINIRGVYTINLWKNNKAKQFGIGQLVAQHFLKKQNEDDVVMHIGDKTNDNVKNLKYVSLAETMYNKKNKKNIKDNMKEFYTKGEFKNYKEMAQKNGIKIKQLYKRLYEGWNVDDAVSIPMLDNKIKLNKKLYKYKDKLYSIKDLSILSGINERALRKRLKRRWTIEDAVEIPLAKNNKN